MRASAVISPAERRECPQAFPGEMEETGSPLVSRMATMPMGMQGMDLLFHGLLPTRWVGNPPQLLGIPPSACTMLTIRINIHAAQSGYIQQRV